jgi:hypothetical protein
MSDKRGSAVLLSPKNLICGGALIAAVILAAVLYPGLGSLSIWSSLIALGVGAALWGVLHMIKSNYRITFVEATIASVVLLVLVVPLTDHFGSKFAFDNTVTYHEFWGGYETGTSSQTFQCHESGSEGGDTGGCVNTFDADSYTVQVPHQSCTTTNNQTTCTTYYTTETRWRQVPYTQTETTWIVHTTLGDYTVGDHWLEANPSAHRIRAEDGSMDSYGNRSSGTPTLWSAAKQRVDSGDPGPVTAQRDYANYILSTQDAALKTYSPYINQYKAAGILPSINHTVQDSYYLDRAYFVGNTGANQSDWQVAVNRYDAAIGADLQGDMYVVIVDSSKVSDPDTYIKTLTAYWESPAFDKFDISKNGIIVVLGTKDGKTVDWARASTGMPTGNSTMIYAIQNNLKGTALTPAAVLGNPTATITQVNGKTKVAINHTQSEGALESIMWSQQDGFQRVCMVCQGAGQHGVGFSYLKSQIQLTGGQLFAILGVLFLLSCLVWGLAVFLAVPLSRGFTGANPYGLNNSLTRRRQGQWR